MKICRTFAVLSLLAVILVTPVAAQQDKPQEPAMGGPEMEAMMKAMSPGENHEHLEWYAGDWTFINKIWGDPGQPPMESAGTMHGEMILGGRYARTHWKGEMMGMPFEGHGTDGYDNLAKQYVSTWVDNSGTGILYLTGTCENGGKTCTMKANRVDPMTGKDSYLRTVTTWTDQANFRFEIFAPGVDGKEFKAMEMVLKRK